MGDGRKIRRRDKSTVSRGTYILDHILFGIVFGTDIYIILPAVVPVAYYERSMIRMALCMAVTSGIGIVMTYSRYRTNRGTFFDIVSGMALYEIVTIGAYASGIVKIIALVLLSLTAFGMVDIVSRKVRAEIHWETVMIARMRKIGLLLRRNIGVASVFVLICLPFSLKMKGSDVIREVCFQRNGRMPSYQKSDYQVKQRYGDKCGLEENIDTIRLILEDDVWQGLERAEKEKVIEALCFMEAGYLGINYELKLIFTEDLDERTNGVYNHLSHTIYYNAKALDRSNEEAYEVIAHEIRHCYQDAMMEIYVKLSPEERNLRCFDGVNEWVKNDADYISVKNQDNLLEILGYYEQPLEVDARNYGSVGWRRLEAQAEEILGIKN